ncbi:hypothetical protein DFH09DRAFT_1472752 [Mycena vulgaris]|nr:hypothetical protein DFH09DRAFT_1472752 [Mycena vulgaris]
MHQRSIWINCPPDLRAAIVGLLSLPSLPHVALTSTTCLPFSIIRHALCSYTELALINVTTDCPSDDKIETTLPPSTATLHRLVLGSLSATAVDALTRGLETAPPKCLRHLELYGSLSNSPGILQKLALMILALEPVLELFEVVNVNGTIDLMLADFADSTLSPDIDEGLNNLSRLRHEAENFQLSLVEQLSTTHAAGILTFSTFDSRITPWPVSLTKLWNPCSIPVPRVPPMSNVALPKHPSLEYSIPSLAKPMGCILVPAFLCTSMESFDFYPRREDPFYSLTNTIYPRPRKRPLILLCVLRDYAT